MKKGTLSRIRVLARVALIAGAVLFAVDVASRFVALLWMRSQSWYEIGYGRFSITQWDTPSSGTVTVKPAIGWHVLLGPSSVGVSYSGSGGWRGTNSRAWDLYPSWLALGGTGLLGSWLCKRRSHDSCPKCGYNLRGILDQTGSYARCPECGVYVQALPEGVRVCDQG